MFSIFIHLVLLIYLIEIKLSKAVLFSHWTLCFHWLLFLRLTLRAHVKSHQRDVHGIFSLLSGRWEILHLSAAFSSFVSIKPPPRRPRRDLPDTLWPRSDPSRDMAVLRVSSYRKLFEDEGQSGKGGLSTQCAGQHRAAGRSVTLKNIYICRSFSL